jgi:hypothetical protein
MHPRTHTTVMARLRRLFVMLVLIGQACTAMMLSGCGGSSSGSGQTAYDIQAEINAMAKDGKMSMTEVVIWNTVPSLPASKKWDNPYGDKLVFEETLKDTCTNQLSNFSQPLREKILLLKKTYEQRGLE